MKTLIISAVALLAAGTASAQDLLIKGARVHTVTAEGTLEDTDVLVRSGRIAAIGPGLEAPARVTVVEAKGRDLTPGIFGGLNQIGLEELSLEPSTVDSELEFMQPAWQHHWRPEFDITPAFNPRSALVPVARVEGVTWTMSTPSRNHSLIAGQGAAFTLDGRYDAALAGSKTLFVNWGSNAIEGSGGSRAAQYMLFDQAIREVRQPATAAEGALLLPEGRAVLKGYLAGGRVVFDVERAADIRQVVRYAMKNGMKAVISGGDEAWLVADELAAADVPVILNPLNNLPNDFDRIGARLDNAKLLHEAGVRIAFDYDESHQAGKNRQLAGNAAAHGLPRSAALAAITAIPADIFGLGDRGRIELGDVADLVLWSGDPLEVSTVADQVWFAGRAIEMRSRQTELRDRYFELLKAAQPAR